MLNIFIPKCIILKQSKLRVKIKEKIKIFDMIQHPPVSLTLDLTQNPKKKFDHVTTQKILKKNK